MNHFTEGDLQQAATLGITPKQLQQQLNNFRQGFAKTELTRAATVQNGGIRRLEEADIDRYVSAYEESIAGGLRPLKFVPASGAATRMFKDLYEFSSKYFGIDYSVASDYPSVREFLEHIRSFAFFDDLQACMQRSACDFGDYMTRGDFATVINFLLKEQYLGYGSLPKALIKFHRYGSLQRTPLEEHIVEGAEYARTATDEVYLHFTVSPEHHRLFTSKIASIRKYYEDALGVKLHIALSEQKHYTDTLAVDEYNNPVRDEAGHLVFRPGGHGALIENLGECNADIIFIKNIDNVVPDWMKHTTTVYKKALAGLLVEVQQQVFAHLRALASHPEASHIAAAATFASDQLHLHLPADFGALPLAEQCKQLTALLHRPIRVCGMVRNQGEPGGGPFFVRNSQQQETLQIVETAQINTKSPAQNDILNHATHFNPVDLVCATKDHRGRRFDLHQYVDYNTGFISKKTKGAQTVKSQELPGLWNGSMAHWITLFVEVPLATFNPVKTVNDLLRKEHLEG
ncbi:MAG: DUF4301 family protein [Bacteroidales bacterium]|nr:DUF4301 family protein [Bacteroidales bacterium]